MANYTDATKISQSLQRSLTSDERAALTGYILKAVDKWIDRKLETTFSSQAATTRYYDGGDHTVDIDPVQQVSEIKSVNNDNTDSYIYTENTEFVLEPVNEDVKTEIVYRGRNTRYPFGNARIAVTGKFTEYDYTNNEVPSDIVMLATRICSDIIQASSQSTNANVASESLEGHSISYKNVNEIIDKTAFEDPFVAGILESRRDLLVG